MARKGKVTPMPEDDRATNKNKASSAGEDMPLEIVSSIDAAGIGSSGSREDASDDKASRMTPTADQKQSASPKNVESGATSRGRKKALIVAMENYPGDENDLPGCVYDAETFANILKLHFGFTEFKGYADARATLNEVRGGLDWLFSDVGPDDRIVFYYSGHGYQIDNANGPDEEALVLFDGFLHDDEFVQRSQNLPDGVLTVVLDSCFAGGLEKTFSRIADIIAERSPVPGESPALSAVIQSVKRLESSTEGKIKVYVPESELSLKALVESSSRKSEKAVKRFGSKNLGRLSLPTDEENQPGLKGILISACLENEKASARTPLTEGLSAFTYGLQRVISEEGTRISAAVLATKVTAVLRGIGIKQTPRVKEPAASGLAELAFVELRDLGDAQARSSATRTGAGAGRSLEEIIARRVREILRTGGGSSEDKAMSAGQTSYQSDKFFPGFEQVVGIAVPAAVNAISGLLKDYQGRPGQDKFGFSIQF